MCRTFLFLQARSNVYGNFLSKHRQRHAVNNYNIPREEPGWPGMLHGHIHESTDTSNLNFPINISKTVSVTTRRHRATEVWNSWELNLTKPRMICPVQWCSGLGLCTTCSPDGWRAVLGCTAVHEPLVALHCSCHVGGDPREPAIWVEVRVAVRHAQDIGTGHGRSELPLTGSHLVSFWSTSVFILSSGSSAT